MAEEMFLAYAAGLFDGEGCVVIHRVSNINDKYRSPAHHVKASICNTNPKPMRILKDEFGGFLVTINKEREDRKTAWVWLICAKKAINFLKAILPYAIIKKDEIELALEFQEQCLTWGRNKRITQDELEQREGYKQHLSEMKRITYVN